MNKKQKPTRRDFLHEGAALVAVLAMGDALVACGGADETQDLGGGGAAGQPDAGPDAPNTGGTAGQGGQGQGGAGQGGEAGAGGQDGGVVDAEPDVGQEAGPPAKRPSTTVRERIVGELPTQKQSTSQRKLWGVTKIAPGEPHTALDPLNVASIADTPTGEPHSIFYGVQLTDIHLLDEESPARTMKAEQLAQAAWRAQESYATQVLDAMVRKIHKFDAFRPVDCVIFSGDLIDNNQYNELSWFTQILEGGKVDPDSGDDEDPKPGLDNDPHDPFNAMGLGNIPWIAAVGNHDVLVAGNFGHKAGSYAKWPGPGDPTADHPGWIGGANPPTCNPISPSDADKPDRCMPTWPSHLTNAKIPPDPDRRELSRKEWINMMRGAPGLPQGHGLTKDNSLSGHGNYTYDPVPGAPLRIIALDTAADIYASGVFSGVDSFLKPELDKAVQDKVLVIVISHHPTDETNTGSQIRQALNACPNVVLHLVGHGHRHKLYERPGSTPQLGYHEVQTSSLVCWPQEGRLVELVDNRDGTADIWLTVFNYDTDHQPTGALAEASRFLSLYEVHNGDQANTKNMEGNVDERNVTLRVAVPDEIRPLLDAMPDTPVESKLFA